MIVAEEVPRCLFIRQAAQRYLDMLEEAEKPGALFYFSDAWACDFLSFFETMCVHSGGEKGDTFVAQPWQVWIGCALFGFRRNNPDEENEIGARLTREVYIEVPRGSGKSGFSAIIGLYCWLYEPENGSQIYIAGPKEEQARHVFGPMSSIIKITPGLAEYHDISLTVSKITRKNDPEAKIRMISSVATREDGANPHVVIMEELHAQDELLFNVMDSSLGKRINNLFFSITTAGQRAQGVCWVTRKRVVAQLAGQNDEQSLFGLIYTLDKEECEDKRIAHQPDRWFKCNPMLGITLSKSTIEDRYHKAVAQSPAAVLEFERTRLNIWSMGASGLIAQEDWDKCKVEDFNILDLRGNTAWMGVDLSTRDDLCSMCIIADDPENQNLMNVHWEHFVPSRSKAFLHDEIGPMYQNWVKGEFLTMTRGGVADFDYIEERIRHWLGLFDVQAIMCDNYQSNYLVKRLHDDGYPADSLQPGTKQISDPFKDVSARIQAGYFRHDGNPLTAWMAANTVGYYDQRDNVLPKKEDTNSRYKIDGISALCFANAARCDKFLNIETKKPHIYARRGVLGADRDKDSSPDS